MKIPIQNPTVDAMQNALPRFYHSSSASGEMKVQVKGEGLTSAGSLHLVSGASRISFFR